MNRASVTTRGAGELGYPFFRMKRGSWAPLFCLALATVSAPARAQQRSGGADASSPSMTEDQVKAQQHFQRAKDLYQSGSYREAAAELEVARKLDPKAKDLVMNLGIIHEKLGMFDEAVSYFKTYLAMEGVTAAERAKAEGMIKRIEGAKREVPAAAPATGSTPSPAAHEPPPSPSSSRGRIDPLTIATGSLAVVGLFGGAGLGVYALSSRPDNFVTGRDGSYATLQEKTDDAHTVAVVADIGIGVGVLAAIATAVLYFGRTKEPSRPSTSGSTASSGALPNGLLQRVRLAPLGGVLHLGGTF
jgi:hypothetical protein